MIEKSKVLAITLARGGSKRIERKNIVLVCGKPLIQYTIDEVKKSSYIDKHIVSSDDDEVLRISQNLGVEIHKRSEETSSDTATSANAIKEVLSSLNEDFNIVVEIMCTNPLKTAWDIDKSLEKLCHTGADSVVSVTRIWDHHPSRVKYIENDTLKSFYPEIPESRRQDLTPAAYVRNGSIYAFKVNSFLEEGIRACGVCRPYVMPEERSINIDEEIDLDLANLIMKRRQ